MNGSLACGCPLYWGFALNFIENGGSLDGKASVASCLAPENKISRSGVGYFSPVQRHDKFQSCSVAISQSRLLIMLRYKLVLCCLHQSYRCRKISVRSFLKQGKPAYDASAETRRCYSLTRTVFNVKSVDYPAPATHRLIFFRCSTLSKSLHILLQHW